MTWRYQHRYRLSEDFLRFVSVYLFGALVPTYDGAVYGFPNDGIVRSFDESAMAQQDVSSLVMLGDVRGNHGSAHKHAVSAFHRTDSDRDFNGMAVLVADNRPTGTKWINVGAGLCTRSEA
jgi:hypothetical protein